MRLHCKRSILFIYIVMCGTLTLINYRFTLIRSEMEQQEEAKHTIVRLTALSSDGQQNDSMSSGLPQNVQNEKPEQLKRNIITLRDPVNKRSGSLNHKTPRSLIDKHHNYRSPKHIAPSLASTPVNSTKFSKLKEQLTITKYLNVINAAMETANRTIQKIFGGSKIFPTTSKSKPTEPEHLPIYPEESQDTDRILEQLKFRPKTLRPGTLNIYLPQGFGAWHVKPGAEEFVSANCPVQNCQLTASKEQAVSADAVIFRQYINKIMEENKRKAGQIWIYYNLESPEYSGGYSGVGPAINWTATYRWDSDIVSPYERYTPLDQIPQDQLPLLKTKFPALFPRKSQKLRDFSKGKTKMAAWFVSHCTTANYRERYVRELAKHVQVDIYGTCGPLKCARHDPKCSQMLDEDYKFYIAFENCNCKDYITEKYYINGLGRRVLPIVMGATKEDYLRMSPPNSFIHVDDFKDAAALARHLHYLDTNNTAYNQYFQWKGQGAFINTKFWCRLCAMLNEPKPKVYPSISQWWRSYTPPTCIKGKWPSSKVDSKLYNKAT